MGWLLSTALPCAAWTESRQGLPSWEQQHIPSGAESLPLGSSQPCLSHCAQAQDSGGSNLS